MTTSRYRATAPSSAIRRGPHSAVALIIGHELARGWQEHFADDLAVIRHAVRITSTPALPCDVRDPEQAAALLSGITRHVLRLREPAPCPPRVQRHR